MEYTLVGIFWSFCIYSFLGWCVEEMYASFAYRRFTNRGFLNGPVCPIYGFGANIIILALTPLKKNIFVVYLASVLLTSTLEFFTGLILEKLFNQKWWDYTDDKFNIMGYVCLNFSLLWGAACVFLMYVLQPISLKIYLHLTYRQIRILLATLFIIYVCDIIATLVRLLKVEAQFKPFSNFARYLHSFSDDIGMYIFSRAMFILKVRELAESDIKKAGAAYKRSAVHTKTKAIETRMFELIKSRLSK